MPFPGQQDNERLIHRGGELWKIGACRNDPPNPHGIIGTDAALRIIVDGFSAEFADVLTDGNGAAPIMLGNPNQMIILEPIKSEVAGDVSVIGWSGVAGSVNAQGCAEGTLSTHRATAAVSGRTGSLIAAVYVLAKLQSGLCAYLQYAVVGYPFFNRITDGGQSIRLNSAMGVGPLPAATVKGRGRVTIEKVTA